ncbi:hypothetical protein ACVWXL_001460 [Bradyrhizobium sp. GM22.5]
MDEALSYQPPSLQVPVKGPFGVQTNSTGTITPLAGFEAGMPGKK